MRISQDNNPFDFDFFKDDKDKPKQEYKKEDDLTLHDAKKIVNDKMIEIIVNKIKELPSGSEFRIADFYHDETKDSSPETFKRTLKIIDQVKDIIENQNEEQYVAPPHHITYKKK